jgi:PKD repeat protein
MNAKFLLLLLLGNYCINGYAQILFQKAIGGPGTEYATDGHQTTDGGFIATAITTSFGGELYLIKTDSAANITWTKAIGGTTTTGGVQRIEQTADAGYIVATGTMGFGAGFQDVLLLKTDSVGNLQWAKTFGGSNMDYANSIQILADGGYVISGVNTNQPGIPTNFYLLRTDFAGNALWQKSYGGPDHDIGRCVRATSDGGYILCGTTNSLGAGSSDVLIVKTDATGDTLWSRTFGGPAGEAASYILPTDSGYLFAGFTSSYGAGMEDVLLIALDTLGNPKWAKTFGGDSTDYATWIRPTNDGGFIISGYTNSFGMGGLDIYVIKVNGSGDTLWTRTYGGTDRELGSSVEPTPDGGYFIAGYTFSFGAGGQDVYLLKTDSSGHTACSTEHSTNTVVGTVAIMVTRPSLQVITPVYQGTPANPAFSSGGIETDICSFTPQSAFRANDTAICPGHCVNFTDLSLNGVTEWHWSFPGATPDTSSAENPLNVCYPTSGFYPVTLITRNGVGYDTLTVSGYVEVRQAPPVSISLNGDTIQAYNAVTYQWYVDGNIINGANTSFYIAPGPGSYTVVITDVYGCVATSNPIVITGIADLSESGIKVYPVPAGDCLNVVLPEENSTGVTYSVKNALGETIIAASASGAKKIAIDVKALPRGNYILQLQTNKDIQSKRFVKE